MRKKLIIVVCIGMSIVLGSCMKTDSKPAEQNNEVIETELETPTPSDEEQDILTEDNFLIIAHRGASGYAPEHTMKAYELAVEMDADYIEIDLQMTADGELIAMHDDKVDRTTDGTGTVSDMTLEEIKDLDAGTWFNEVNPAYFDEGFVGLTVPTLKEILETFGSDVNYYIETKAPDTSPGMEEALLEQLTAHNLLEDPPSGKVIIQSFSKESLQWLHKLNEDIPYIQLVYKGDTKMMTEQSLEEMSHYAIGIGPHYKDLNEENITNIQEFDLLIHPYTINDTEEIMDLKSLGVDGVFTNYIDAYQAE